MKVRDKLNLSFTEKYMNNLPKIKTGLVTGMRLEPYYMRLLNEVKKKLSRERFHGGFCSSAKAVKWLLDNWVESLPVELSEKLKEIDDKEIYPFDEKLEEHQVSLGKATSQESLKDLNIAKSDLTYHEPTVIPSLDKEASQMFEKP